MQGIVGVSLSKHHVYVLACMRACMRMCVCHEFEGMVEDCMFMMNKESFL